MAAILMVAAALAGVGTGQASADGRSWAVSTAANDLGSDRPNYRYNLNPGEHVTDGLVVTNPGPGDLDLQIYSADAFTTPSGHLDLQLRAAKPIDIGAWVRPDLSQVRIGPGRSTTVPFTISVPADARPGDHVGGIVTSLQTHGADGQIEQRRGIRIAVRVGGRLHPGLSVEGLTITYTGSGDPLRSGSATVSYTLHNTGNAVLGGRQTAAVSGPFQRWQAKPAPVPDSPQLLPGERWKVSVPIPDVTPAVRLTATVRLVPLLGDAAGSVMPLTSTATTTHTWAVPWLWAGAAALLCAVVVAIAAATVQSRRHRPQPK